MGTSAYTHVLKYDGGVFAISIGVTLTAASSPTRWAVSTGLSRGR